MKKMMKKIITAVICAMLLAATMGMTVLAAMGTISGSLSGSTGTVKLTNTSGGTKLCVVVLREYEGYYNNETIVSSNSGNISNYNSISTSGKISKSHARGVGMIYNSTTYASGVASTITTSIK